MHLRKSLIQDAIKRKQMECKHEFSEERSHIDFLYGQPSVSNIRFVCKKCGATNGWVKF